MQLLGCSGCLLGGFYAVAGVFWLFVRGFLCSYWGVLVVCWGVSMQLLGCSGCLLGGFYAVTGVFWLFVRAFLCSCWGVLVVC